MMKKIVAILCVMMLVMSLFAGCGGNNDTNTENDNKNNVENNNNNDKNTSTDNKKNDKENEENKEEDKDTSENQNNNEPEEISLEKNLKISIDLLDTNEDDRVKWLEEKFNVDFDLIVTSLDEVNEKVRIWINSDDMPDTLFWPIAGSTFPEYVKYAKQGAFKEYPDLVNYPNLNKFSESLKSDEALMVEDKFYAWPVSRGSTEIGNMWLGGFYYREDWAKEVGKYKEGDYTWEEMIDMIKTIQAEDPGNNGEGKTIGMGMTGWAKTFAVSHQYLPTEGYFLKDGKAVWGAGEPEMLDYIKMYNRMYDENVIWSDQLVAGGSDAKNRFIAGQMTVYYHGGKPSQLTDLRDSFKEANPDVDREAVQFLPVLSPESGKLHGFQTEDYWGCTLFPHNVDEEKFERMLYILDWMTSQEGQAVLTNGIEGVDWEKDGDGVKFLKEGFDARQEYNHRIFGLALLTPVYWELTGSQTVNPVDRDDSFAWAKRVSADNDLDSLDYELSFLSTPLKEQYGDFRSEVRDRVTQIIVDSDDIEGDYNAYLEEMLPKVKPVLDEMNAALGN